MAADVRGLLQGVATHELESVRTKEHLGVAAQKRLSELPEVERAVKEGAEYVKLSRGGDAADIAQAVRDWAVATGTGAHRATCT